MYCITKHDMKFGDYFIPARTKATVINTPRCHDADIPGLYLQLAISLWDMLPTERKEEGVPVFVTQINNEMENESIPFNTQSQMVGIVVDTNSTQVYLDAGDDFYFDATISEWKVKKIFDGIVPEQIEKRRYVSKEYYLRSIIEYLDEEFTEWVQKNCHFRKLTKQDIENGEGFDGASPGDRILSTKGMKQFEEKKRKYQAKLETIGFTYDFKGGLIWD